VRKMLMSWLISLDKVATQTRMIAKIQIILDSINLKRTLIQNKSIGLSKVIFMKSLFGIFKEI
jgi:hypothetical protein